MDRRDNAALTVGVRQLPIPDLPAGEVDISVEHSSVNYKDALILSESGYRAQRYPMVPGIDLAGTVLASTDAAFSPGDRIVLNGDGLGESRWGGYAERAVVSPHSLVLLPPELSTRDAMVMGTAGLAAALGILALLDHGLSPQSGPVLVTGASGGVGNLAVSVLAKLGFEVTASAGRTSTHRFLTDLGAKEVIGRLPKDGDAPLRKERWAGALDTVGGNTLSSVLAEMAYGAKVASLGFSGGMITPLNLAPLLVRGVSIAGINTSLCPIELRRRAWTFLAGSFPRGLLEESVMVASLAEVPETAQALLRGEIQSRVVVDPRAD
ncbi:MAG TPA: acryloyl-CoA reductase [Rhodanobacteraceae bacterium]|nr:acryloyl-CoA reductase [Rhodanobacteraceae bacterium]